MANKSRETLGPVTLFWNALSLGVERWMMMVNDQRNRAGDDSLKLTDAREWERWANLASRGVLEVKQRLHSLATDLEPFVPDAPRVATRIGLLADRLWTEWLPMVKPGPWTEAEATTIRELHAEVSACVAILRNASTAEEDHRRSALGDNDHRVLRALAASSKALHVLPLAQATQRPRLPALSDKTVGACLGRLESLGLARRLGPRSGWIATTKGQSRVAAEMTD